MKVEINSLLSAVAIGLLFGGSAHAQDCPSSTTVKLNSTNYSGGFNVELRKGTRPGSKMIAKKFMSSAGQTTFENVCSGKYFIAFGTPDSDEVNVTRYFDITYDGYSYSNPTITVYYSRVNTNDSQRVKSAKRRDL